MSGDRSPAMPPVRLPSEAELARAALAAPRLSRAVRLARWAGAGVPVDAAGELSAGVLPKAAAELDLTAAEHGTAETAACWRLAVVLGLVEVGEGSGAPEPGAAGTAGGVRAARARSTGDAASPGSQGSPAGPGRGTAGGAEGTVARTAVPGPAGLLESGPSAALELWQRAVAAVLAETAGQPPVERPVELPPQRESTAGAARPRAVGSADSPDSPDFADFPGPGRERAERAERAEFLDGALANLYLFTASDTALATGAMVPLPVLAASMVLPDDMAEPSDEALVEVSETMLALDDQLRLLEPIGLVEYRPVDRTPTGGSEQPDGEDSGPYGGTDSDRAMDGDAGADGHHREDIARYGMVRLTPLGLYGVRARLRARGVAAPLVGELADRGADVLLGALPGHTESAAQAEIEQWLARRTPRDAAGQLLAAARGDDPDAPQRRLFCQQALSLIGPEAGPALREVLDDRQLGGLARVWLAEHGVRDVPPPAEEMVFWLTVDTLAAQLAAEGDSAELRDLVRGLADQHSGFFDKAWRVDHPAAGDVLEVMGRVHPDRSTAKAARKAAFKARSRADG